MMERGTAQPVVAMSTDTERDFGERPKVIYVMGAGRSGSTILGVTLGNCADFFYAGELDKWLLMSGISMHERNGAANETREDPGLWKLVRDDVRAPVDLFGRQARRCIEHSSALLRVDKWLTRRRLRPRYRRVTEDLYRAVARRVQATHIVDSSHLPLRARQLQRLPGIDMYLIYLVRDPCSVVASWGRRGLPEPRFSMPATNAYLWLTNLLSVLAFLRQPRGKRLFVRYEDFVADPSGVLRDILSGIGLPSESIPDLTALHVGAPYHGNRLIFSDVVSLGSAPGASPERSWITILLQLPWRAILPLMRPVAGAPASRVGVA